MNKWATILAGLLGSSILAGAALAADTTNVPLVTAAKIGDRAAVRTLLNGIPQKVIAGPEGAAALVWAASHNDLEMADILLRAGADAKSVNEFGATALYAAATSAELPMTQTDFHHARPVYEHLEGWSDDIAGVRRFEDLPKAAQAYVLAGEELSGARVSAVGVAPAA